MGKLNFNVVGAGNEMFFVFKNGHGKLCTEKRNPGKKHIASMAKIHSSSCAK